MRMRRTPKNFRLNIFGVLSFETNHKNNFIYFLKAFYRKMSVVKIVIFLKWNFKYFSKEIILLWFHWNHQAFCSNILTHILNKEISRFFLKDCLSSLEHLQCRSKIFRVCLRQCFVGIYLVFLKRNILFIVTNLRVVTFNYKI